MEKESSINKRDSPEGIPIYVNLKIGTEQSKMSENRDIQKLKTNSLNSRKNKSPKADISKNKTERTADTSDFTYTDRTKERRSESGTDSIGRTKHSINKDTVSRSAYKDALSRRMDKDKQRYSSDLRGKLNEELNTSGYARKTRDIKSKTEQNHTPTTEKKDHRSRSLQRPKPKAVSDESSRDKSTMKADQRFKESVGDNHDASSNCKRNVSRDKTHKETVIPSLKLDPSSTARNSSVQSKSFDKDYSIKSNNHKTNKHREYIINYDDKNGTVSSICKVTPSLGTPKRKKTSKEILKDNHNNKLLKNKTVDIIAPRK